MKRIITISLMLFPFVALQAQKDEEPHLNNLVKNPGFEMLDGKPKKVGDLNKATGWYSPTQGTSDLFSKQSKTPEIMVPTNSLGVQDPRTGDSYAGAIFYSKRDDQREYLLGELVGPLEAGETYCVEFYVSAADLGKYSINQVGVVFPNQKLQYNNWDPIPLKPAFGNHELRFLDRQDGWQIVCGEYTAKGDELFIMIGNYTSKENTKVNRMRKPRGVAGLPQEYGYYYIDDVSVVNKNELDGKCGCEEKIAKENAGGMNIVYSKVVGESDEELDMLPEDMIESKSIFFSPSGVALLPQSKTDLDYISQLMIQNKDIKIELIGSSDPDEYTSDPMLGQKRAEAIMKALVEAGVKGERLQLGSARKPAEKTAAEESVKSGLRRCDFSIIFE